MIVYRIGNAIYINLTNRCSNNCSFCVRTTSKEYEEYGLWLKKEPTAEEVFNELKKTGNADEYVFCGYGEPLYALNVLLPVADFLKQNGKKVRLNTNGQADLIIGQGVAKQLKGRVDEVSISLNAPNAKEYNAICACDFGEEGFYSLLRFAEECKNEGIRTKFSIVDTGEVDIEQAKKLAEKMGIPLRVRALIV